MADRAIYRLQDMKAAIQEIDALLSGRTFDVMYGDKVVRAAFERFLEILSEASRSVPDDWKKAAAPEIPWRRIADLGNHIRHAYHKLDAELLWNVYEDHLGALEAAVDDMLVKHAPERDLT
ncbi:HepT-like ribonuclease domain-containing protein [Hansschlegelia plantiphila]|uniref:DUF86 domain-containing protein n=1 Tax=Hansschlegelia plantiphila TaxID=374655 RepID=A0A9W6IZW0_9HYPH|nr:HepT-like ribonuclease domain-containing protein [Hansschlegelia plantiphila]GLK66848.1 DUF86 domain-containing protein [Hansschlegelia plantiphila]